LKANEVLVVAGTGATPSGDLDSSNPGVGFRSMVTTDGGGSELERRRTTPE
jgi:hypothetical protein